MGLQGCKSQSSVHSEKQLQLSESNLHYRRSNSDNLEVAIAQLWNELQVCNFTKL